MNFIKSAISYLVFPFQGSLTIKFFRGYLPFADDIKVLYFSLYGELCADYSITATILNKPLLDDFKKKYPRFCYLSHFLNSSYHSDIGIVDYQQMQFLIMLKPKLFIEYDSMGTYQIYYQPELEAEIQEVLNVFRKHQRLNWPKSFRYIHLN